MHYDCNNIVCLDVKRNGYGNYGIAIDSYSDDNSNVLRSDGGNTMDKRNRDYECKNSANYEYGCYSGARNVCCTNGKETFGYEDDSHDTDEALRIGNQ